MPQLGKLTLTLTEEVVKATKKKAWAMFGHRKGAISVYVEMVLRNDLHLKPREGVEEE